MMRFIFMCVIFLGVNAIQIDEESQLLSVIVFFRHGDRVPRKFAPLDPYGDSKFWPAGRGELTNAGKQQVYSLGQWLRNRYNDYLPINYSNKDIYIKSSSVNRCLMSAKAILAGLYQSKDDQKWNSSVVISPFLIYNVPKEEDFIFEMAASCPKYVAAYDELLATEHFREIDASNYNFYQYLGEHLGVKINSFTDIAEWYDTMREEDVKGFKLPNWTKKYYPAEMEKWSELCYKVPTYNQRLARFATGIFFEIISNHFSALKNGSSNTLASKMVLLSGHQTNIADITNSLGMFRLSPYAGAFILELRKSLISSNVYINTFFKSNETLETLRIENCTINCNLENFFTIVEPLRIRSERIKTECGLQVHEKTTHYVNV